MKLEEYQKSLTFLNYASPIIQKIGTSSQVAGHLSNLGSIYYQLEKYQEAIDYYQKSLSISQQIAEPLAISTGFKLSPTKLIYKSKN